MNDPLRDPAVFLVQSRDLRHGGQPEAALDVIDQALAFPWNRQVSSSLHAEASVSLTLLERHNDATTALSRALKLNPDNVKARTLMARALMRVNNFIHAELHLQRALAVDPQNRDARQSLEALAAKRAAKKAAPAPDAPLADTAEDALLAGNRLRSRGFYAEASVILKDSLARFPDADVATVQRTRITLATSLLKINKQEEAHDLYKAVLAQDADNKFAHGGLAGIYCKNGLYDQAKVHAEKLLAIEPDSFFGLYYLTKIAVVTEQMDEARQLYKRLNDTHGMNQKAHKQLLAVENLVYPDKVYPATVKTHAAPAIVPRPAPVSAPPAIPAAAPLPGAPLSPEELVASFRMAGLKPKDPTARQREFAALHRHDALTRPAPLPAELSAVEKLELRIARNPRDVGAYQLLASLLLREGRKDEAIGRLREVLLIDTKNSPARQMLQKLEAAVTPPQEPGTSPV